MGGWGDGSGRNVSYGERQMKLDLLAAAHLLLCGPVPNRPSTGTSPWPGGWGPLHYITFLDFFRAWDSYSRELRDG